MSKSLDRMSGLSPRSFQLKICKSNRMWSLDSISIVVGAGWVVVEEDWLSQKTGFLTLSEPQPDFSHRFPHPSSSQTTL